MGTHPYYNLNLQFFCEELNYLSFIDGNYYF